MDLAKLLADLKEQRWKTAHLVGGAHHGEMLTKLTTLHAAISAVEAVISENRGEPDNTIDASRPLIWSA
jgi:hypothetical protein